MHVALAIVDPEHACPLAGLILQSTVPCPITVTAEPSGKKTLCVRLTGWRQLSATTTHLNHLLNEY